MSALLAVNWHWELRGTLIVIIAVGVLCGSLYLILGTNLGARLGFLVAFAGLAGWMFILGAIWWSYGKGLLGDDTQWRPVDNNTIIRESRAPILPPGAEDDASLESFRLAAERVLLELARDSYAEMRQRMPEALVKRLGEHGIPAAVTPAP